MCAVAFFSDLLEFCFLLRQHIGVINPQDFNFFFAIALFRLEDIDADDAFFAAIYLRLDAGGGFFDPLFWQA